MNLTKLPGKMCFRFNQIFFAVLAVVLSWGATQAAGLVSLFEAAGKETYKFFDEAKFNKVVKEIPSLTPNAKDRANALMDFGGKMKEVLKTENQTTRAILVRKLVRDAEDSALIDYVEARLPKPDTRFFPENAEVPTAGEIMPMWREQFRGAAAGVGMAVIRSPEEYFWKIVGDRMPNLTRSFKFQKQVFCLPETDPEFEDIFGFAPKGQAVEKMADGFRNYRGVGAENPKTIAAVKAEINEIEKNGVLVIVGHNPNGVEDPVIRLGKGTDVRFGDIEKWAIEADRTVVVVSCFSPHVAPRRYIKTVDALDILEELSWIKGDMHPQEYFRRISRNCELKLALGARRKETRITVLVVSAGAAGVSGGGIVVMKDHLEERQEQDAQKQ